MKNIFKKLSLIIATAAIFFAGAANIYADENSWDREEYNQQRFLEIETGGDES